MAMPGWFCGWIWRPYPVETVSNNVLLAGFACRGQAWLLGCACAGAWEHGGGSDGNGRLVLWLDLAAMSTGNFVQQHGACGR